MLVFCLVLVGWCQIEVAPLLNPKPKHLCELYVVEMIWILYLKEQP